MKTKTLQTLQVLAASRCALAIMLAMMTKVMQISLMFQLHLASTKSHDSWSDIVSLRGLRNRPSWLKTHSTGADVHSVQKRFPKVAPSMQVYIYLVLIGFREN